MHQEIYLFQMCVSCVSFLRPSHNLLLRYHGHVPCLLGYLFIRLRWLWVNTSYRLGPSVNALQYLTGKVDNNNNNNVYIATNEKLLYKEEVSSLCT